MKTLHILLLALLTLLASCSGNRNDLRQAGLEGKVEYFKERQYNPTYQDEKWVAGDPLTDDYRVVHYDPEGYFLKSYAINDRGDTIGMSTVKREDGEIVEETFYSKFYLNPKDSEMFQTSKTLLNRVSDEQVNFEIWEGDKIKYEGANYHDSKGRIVKQVQILNGQEVVFHHVYEKDLLMENYSESAEGERLSTQLYEYTGFDKEGNWTAKLVYNDDERIKPDVVVKRELTYY